LPAAPSWTAAARPGYRADIGIRGDRIVRVSRSRIAHGLGARVIDAAGHVVAPGFIDLHAHLDPLLRLPGAESHVRQGVTTALGGPDGGGEWPLGAYLDAAEALGVGMNVAFLVGPQHRPPRRSWGSRPRADADELARMRRMVAQAMDEGAFGLSTGLRYTPGAYLARPTRSSRWRKVAAAHGGIYTSHLRDEGWT
jgi:N-acyl-D-amino-acid deacylase